MTFPQIAKHGTVCGMNQAIDWNGPKRQACPSCSRGDRDKTLGVTTERGLAHCFRCGHVETLHGHAEKTQQRPAPIVSAHERLSEYGRQMWSECLPISGEAAAYLSARRCARPPADGDLRWHPALRHPPSGIAGPALVGLVTDAITGEPLTLHRTWVNADGTKAAMNPPRMLLGGHRKAGGVIRLWPDEAVTTGLAVAEGIETALSLAHVFTPVWSVIDAGNLRALPLLRGVESLVIGADHDEAGLQAAGECAKRWDEGGADVTIVRHQKAKADINDMEAA